MQLPSRVSNPSLGSGDDRAGDPLHLCPGGDPGGERQEDGSFHCCGDESRGLNLGFVELRNFVRRVKVRSVVWQLQAMQEGWSLQPRGGK